MPPHRRNGDRQEQALDTRRVVEPGLGHVEASRRVITAALLDLHPLEIDAQPSAGGLSVGHHCDHLGWLFGGDFGPL
ncbi:MAG: hypothetical protein SNJ69_12760 [Chloroflexaceae bacterium]